VEWLKLRSVLESGFTIDWVLVSEQANDMRSETRTLEWFLKDPRCRKWIVQCSACHLFGRKSDTPSSIPKFRFEEMFPIMELDENGRCSYCRAPDSKQ
jgi:hypothetical protein